MIPSEPIYVLHCNKCSYKRHTNGYDLKDLIEVKTVDLQRHFPIYDPNIKKNMTILEILFKYGGIFINHEKFFELKNIKELADKENILEKYTNLEKIETIDNIDNFIKEIYQNSKEYNNQININIIYVFKNSRLENDYIIDHILKTIIIYMKNNTRA